MLAVAMGFNNYFIFPQNDEKFHQNETTQTKNKKTSKIHRKMRITKWRHQKLNENTRQDCKLIWRQSSQYWCLAVCAGLGDTLKTKFNYFMAIISWVNGMGCA